jgi:hypothetical protein
MKSMQAVDHHRVVLPVVLCLCFVLLGVRTARAVDYDLEDLLPNLSFESGLTGWSYTGAGVNPDTYLTDDEWSVQTWSASSPFYSDAELATYYPGQPWGLDPDITHIDQSGVVGDPTVTITAAVGSHFVGSRQDGYEGHYRRDPSEPPQPSGGFYDTSFQLTTDSTAGSFQTGDTFTIRLWGLRGRLRQDWGVPNANSPGSASILRARLTGGTFSVGNINFTAWDGMPDGNWYWQDLTWTLESDTASIRLVITARNQNHDRFVAVDSGTPSSPVESATWGTIKALYR